MAERRIAMRIATALIAATLAATVHAKLPPPTPEAQAQAAEAKAKSAWADKVAMFQLCQAMDRTVDAYRSNMKATGKDAPAPVATPPCADPGAYVPVAAASGAKPLEAAGAHSPPDTSGAPPNEKATAAEIGK
jgi:hypothetical protein